MGIIFCVLYAMAGWALLCCGVECIYDKQFNKFVLFISLSLLCVDKMIEHANKAIVTIEERDQNDY